MHIQLLHEPAAVEFRGLHADVEDFRDLLGRFPLPHQLQDLTLPGRQPGSIGRRAGQPVHDRRDAPGLTYRRPSRTFSIACTSSSPPWLLWTNPLTATLSPSRTKRAWSTPKRRVTGHW